MALKKNWFLFLDFLVKRCAVANLCFIWYKSKTWTMYYIWQQQKKFRYGSERKILFGIAGIASILKKN